MKVFVFPMMNMNLFPATTKPLNIFEPRYVTLFKEAVRTQTPVVLAFVDDPYLGSEALEGRGLVGVRPVAGYGTASIIEDRADGTLLVFVRGSGRVRLASVKDRALPFLVCEAEVLPNESMLKDEMTNSLAGLYRILRRWVHQHIPDPAQREIFLSGIRTPEEIVGAFSAYLVRDYDLQHFLLEEADINLRIQMLFRLLESNELAA